MRETSLSFHRYGCRLNRDDLNQLAQLTMAGTSPKASLLISAERGITKFSADSLAELWAEMKEPARLDELRISMRDPDPDQPGQATTVWITMEKWRVYVSVSGNNETWVRGRTEELRDYLRAKSVRLAVNPDSVWAAPMVAALLALAGTSPALIARVPLSGTLLLGAGLLLSALLGVFWFCMRSRTQITLVDVARSPWSRDNRIGLAGLLVAILTLAATIIVIIITPH